MVLGAAGCASSGLPDPTPSVAAPSASHYEAELVGGTVCQADGSAWILCQQGGAITVLPLYRQSGRYLVRVRVWQDAAGEEDAAMSVTTESRSFGPFAVSARKDDPVIIEQMIDAEMGTGIVRVAFLNDHYRPEVGEDRNLYVDWIEVDGPLIGGALVRLGDGQ